MQTRKSSRAIVLNKQNQIFLFQYTFDFFAEKESIWITPGGGLDDGESFEEFSYDGWTESENKRMNAGKWWSLEEIKVSGEKFFSEDILGILERLSKGELPKEPIEIA